MRKRGSPAGRGRAAIRFHPTMRGAAAGDAEIQQARPARIRPDEAGTVGQFI